MSGLNKITNSKKIFLTGDGALSGRVSILENNVYKVTYYEIISGASGTLTVPTGATINSGEFSGANCILSEIDGNNKPTYVTPLDAGTNPVTSTLNVSNRAWVKSGVTVSTNVALIYSLNIKAIDYSNLNNFYIIETALAPYFVSGTNANDTYGNVYFMGDSLTDAGVYPYQIGANLGSTWNLFNYGRSGDTTTGMLARFNSQVINTYKPTHVVILGGTNDVSALTSAATIQANLQAMYTAAKVAGLKVIAVTITPRTTTAPQLAIQQAVNTWIKTVAIDIDYIVDPYATLADPSFPTTLLPAYTYDGLHLTDAGYIVLGNYIYNNATWTKKTNTTNLKVNANGLVNINQDLLTDSEVKFKSINNIPVWGGKNAIYTNTSVGNFSLINNTYGRYNTAFGYRSLSNNTSGNANTAIGHQSMYNNTIGFDNTALGINSLTANTTGNANTAIGTSSLLSNITGNNNTSIGQASMLLNTSGSNNASIGGQCLYANTTGAANVAIGYASLHDNTTGSTNIAIGQAAMYYNTTAGNNTAIGISAMFSNKTGAANVAIGNIALYTNVSSSNNTAIGYNALQACTGAGNTALGINSGQSIITGAQNTFVGYISGQDALQKTNAYNSTAIGGSSYTTKDHQVVIGASTVTETILNGQIVIAGKFIYMIDSTTPFNYWKATLNTGVLTWSDTGTTNKP